MSDTHRWALIRFAVVTASSLACLYLFYEKFDVPKDASTALVTGLIAYILSFAKSE